MDVNVQPLSDEELLDLWFHLGEFPAWEIPKGLTEAVKLELDRRELPSFQKTI